MNTLSFRLPQEMNFLTRSLYHEKIIITQYGKISGFVFRAHQTSYPSPCGGRTNFWIRYSGRTSQAWLSVKRRNAVSAAAWNGKKRLFTVQGRVFRRQIPPSLSSHGSWKKSP